MRGPLSSATIGRFAGPLVFFACILLWRSDPLGVVSGLTGWMALWWMTEAIPIPATSLLPMAILPIFAGRRFALGDVAVAYGNWRIYLFFGGFLIAIAMERTGLHRRIALWLVRRIGTSPRRLVLGFMVATAFLSMWISNTATALMMLPIAGAVVTELAGRPRFGTALMLGVAYAASIGGLGTLIGTPPNLALRGQLHILFPRGPELTFASWLGLGVPLAVTFLPMAWWVLVRRLPRETSGGGAVIDEQIAALGPMSAAERRVLAVFATTALLWIFRTPIDLGFTTLPGWIELFPEQTRAAVNDGVVAMTMGLSLFVIPTGRGGAILDWTTAEAKMPWGILLLFGGGFALATAIRDSGLSAEVGRQFAFLAGAPIAVLMAACSLSVTFLTEVTSNTATAEILLPLVAGIATSSAHVDPLVMMLPVAISASCAFMLPVATPPNAVVFSSGHVRMADMVRHGIVLNLVGVVLVTAICYLLGPVMLGMDLNGVPAWAASPR